MGLKAVLSSLDGLDDSLKALYKQQDDGMYTLQVEGMVTKQKVDEFRTNNITLNKKLQTLENEMSKFKDIDPEKYQEYKQQIELLRDKKLIDEGKIDELVEQKTERMRTEFDTQKTQLQKLASDNLNKYNEVHNQLNDFRLNNELTDIASKAKVRSSAIPDIINRGKSIFKFNEGKIKPFDSNGNIICGLDGTSELTMDEWVKDLNKTAPHLFENSSGGDGRGGGSPGGSKIQAGDIRGFGDNLEAIASGEMTIAKS